MFDSDGLRELLCVLNTNRLRTALTGFSVAWGIFILIILLGSGNGLENGMRDNFRGEALNTIWVFGGVTIQDHDGLNAGREVVLTNGDLDLIQGEIKGVGGLVPILEIANEGPVRRGSQYAFIQVEAISPENRKISQVSVTSGRFLNAKDLKERRKTALIDEKSRAALFGADPALGKAILINGIPFTVVGVFKPLSTYEDQKIYIPFTTGQRLFKGDRSLNGMAFLVDHSVSLRGSREAEARTRILMARKHHFEPGDTGALMTMNSQAESIMMKKFFKGIRLFLWITGLGTIIAGIVGISNIMLITVKERTREIGIRKAVGATPFSIITMVVSEALLITVVAGYVGLVSGIATLEVVRAILASMAANAAASTDAMGSFTVFKDPAVDLGVAVKATLILAASGVLAGFFPARRAALVKPIEAMKE